MSNAVVLRRCGYREHVMDRQDAHADHCIACCANALLTKIESSSSGGSGSGHGRGHGRHLGRRCHSSSICRCRSSHRSSRSSNEVYNHICTGKSATRPTQPNLPFTAGDETVSSDITVGHVTASLLA